MRKKEIGEERDRNKEVLSMPAWLPLFSQSQISLFRSCQRKWSFQYVDKIKVEQSKWGGLGDQIEKEQITPYLVHGRPLDFTLEHDGQAISGDIVAAGIHLLPTPKSNLELQKKIVFNTEIKEFGYMGYVDLWLPQGGLPDAIGSSRARNSTPCIADIKTGNPRYWKTSKDLESDIQANMYARWAFGALPDVEELDLAWINFSTKKPYKAKTSHLRVTRAQVTERFAPIEATACEIHEVRKRRLRTLDLPPNINACGDYNGCPYQRQCNLSPTQIIDAEAATWLRREFRDSPSPPTEETTMTVSTEQPLRGLAALRARAAAAQATTPAPAAPPPVAVPPPQVFAPPPLPFVWAPPVQPPVPAQVMASINPPESQLPPAPPVNAVDVSAPLPGAESPADGSKKRPKRTPGGSTPAPAQLPLPGSLEPLGAVTVTWGEEVIRTEGGIITIGPFAITKNVPRGASAEDVMMNTYDALAAFAALAKAKRVAASV